MKTKTNDLIEQTIQNIEKISCDVYNDGYDDGVSMTLSWFEIEMNKLINKDHLDASLLIEEFFKIIKNEKSNKKNSSRN